MNIVFWFVMETSSGSMVELRIITFIQQMQSDYEANLSRLYPLASKICFKKIFWLVSLIGQVTMILLPAMFRGRKQEACDLFGL